MYIVCIKQIIDIHKEYTIHIGIVRNNLPTCTIYVNSIDML